MPHPPYYYFGQTHSMQDDLALRLTQHGAGRRRWPGRDAPSEAADAARNGAGSWRGASFLASNEAENDTQKR
jgi:hypothetical protein